MKFVKFVLQQFLEKTLLIIVTVVMDIMKLKKKNVNNVLYHVEIVQVLMYV
jgi:hypothetical protein